MVGAGEKVDGDDFFHLVAGRFEFCGVTGKGCGVAGNVNYPLGHKFGRDEFGQSFFESLSWWVNNYHVGFDAPFGQLFCRVGGIGAYKFGVFYSVGGGVKFGIDHCLGYDFGADDSLCPFRHRKTDCACSAVEVENGFLVAFGEVSGNFIKPFCHSTIDLIEGKGIQPNLYSAENIGDVSVAVNDFTFLAENDVCALLVYVKNNGFEPISEGGFQPLDEFVTFWQGISVYDGANHYFIGHFRLTNVYVAYKSLSAHLVINRNAVLLNKLGKKVDYLLENFGLKPTASAIDDAVASLGVKADFEPAIITRNGILRLVSVSVNVIGGNDFVGWGIDRADSPHGIGNTLLLYFAFGIVAYVTKGTSATGGK